MTGKIVDSEVILTVEWTRPRLGGRGRDEWRMSKVENIPIGLDSLSNKEARASDRFMTNRNQVRTVSSGPSTLQQSPSTEGEDGGKPEPWPGTPVHGDVFFCERAKFNVFTTEQSQWRLCQQSNVQLTVQ